jgi:hypothetical protein
MSKGPDLTTEAAKQLHELAELGAREWGHPVPESAASPSFDSSGTTILGNEDAEAQIQRRGRKRKGDVLAQENEIGSCLLLSSHDLPDSFDANTYFDTFCIQTWYGAQYSDLFVSPVSRNAVFFPRRSDDGDFARCRDRPNIFPRFMN